MFDKDLFADRRNASNSAGVPYDPDSLLTGAEIIRGYGYLDKREYKTQEAFNKLVSGEIPPTQEYLDSFAPRRISPDFEELYETLAAEYGASEPSDETGYVDNVVKWLNSL